MDIIFRYDPNRKNPYIVDYKNIEGRRGGVVGRTGKDPIQLLGSVLADIGNSSNTINILFSEAVPEEFRTLAGIVLRLFK